MRAVVIVHLEGDVAADASDAAPHAGAAGAAVVQANRLPEQDARQLRAACHLEHSGRDVETLQLPGVSSAATSVTVVAAAVVVVFIAVVAVVGVAMPP